MTITRWSRARWLVRGRRARSVFAGCLLVALVGAGAVATVAQRHAPPALARVPATPTALLLTPDEPPRSLMGTDMDGRLGSAEGQLILGPGLIRRFEYHLSAIGELPLAQIRANIERDIDAELALPGRREARRLLDAYLALRAALSAVPPPRMGKVDAQDVAAN